MKNNLSCKTPHYILKKHFGYENFRPGQLQIIKNILNQKNTLSILPTGGGKSICFQIPGLIFSGVTVVISPLISLMKDQVDDLKSKGIQACYISSLLSNDEQKIIYQLIKLKKYKFIYIAPERLETKKFQQIIKQLSISLLVIDEAHCISQWGNYFRPSYKKIIQNSNKIFINCPIAAFTATANKKVQQDICKTLELKNPFIYYQSFKRENLFIEIINCHNKTIKNITLLRLLKKHQNQVGIIYCSTRKSTQELTNFLKIFNIEAIFYHGSLRKEQKQNIQLSFKSGHTKIIIATNAFGMGIDVSNIRFVIHYQIPSNVENYYQEIGRAGRDQKKSWCYSLYCKSDEKIQYQLLKNKRTKIIEFEKLKKIFTNNTCRTQKILQHFGEKIKKCNHCDRCKNMKFKSQLMIHINKSEIEIIKKVLTLEKKQKKISRQFPISNTIAAFLAILEPKNKHEFLQVPGIGNGFIKVWYQQLKQLFT